MRYQVEYRAYAKEYEGNPPPFEAEAWGNVSSNKIDAIKRMFTKLDYLVERSKIVSFDTIIEVRVVDDDKKVIWYEKKLRY